MAQHVDDLRNVREGDTVEITTSDGDRFQAECTRREVSNADPRTGQVRETTAWFFEKDGLQTVVSIVDGLKGHPDDPEFPVHKEMWDIEQDASMGYISELTIYGEMEQ